MPEKIKREKDVNQTVNSKHSKRVGRRKLEDTVLSKDMMDFAWLVGTGMDDKIAGRKLGFSDYKIKTYLELAQVQEQIEMARGLRVKEELKQWKEMDEDWRILVIKKAMEIVRASGDKMPKEQMDYVKFLINEWEKKARAEGLNNQNVILSRKVIASHKMTEKTSEKQLTYDEPADEVQYDNESIEMESSSDENMQNNEDLIRDDEFIDEEGEID